MALRYRDGVTAADIAEAEAIQRKYGHIPAKKDKVSSADNRIDLKYPLDDNDYKGRLVFELVEEDTDNEIVKDATKDEVVTEAEEKKEKAQEEIRKKKEVADAALAEAKSKVKRTRQDFRHGTNREVADLKGKAEEKQTILGPNTESEIVELPTAGPKVSIYLPMALNFRDNVSYENTDLGMLGAAAEGGLSQGGGTMDMLKGVVEGTGGTLASVFEGGSDLGALAALQLNVTNKVLGEGVKAAAKQAAGVTLNPNTRSLFKSVAIREFAFQFKFIAKSKKEADEVRKIVKFFRTELYPEAITVDVANTKVAIGYKFPKKFILTPMYNNQPIKDTKILPCYLRDVSVVYNPTNQAMHGGDDPHFTEIDMSLAFTETRTLTRGEIEMEGGY